MKSRRTLMLLGLASVILLALGLSVNQGIQAASPSHSTGATSPSRYTITAGWGNDDYAANIYTPHTIQIYVGDTVTWHNNSLLEAHTITFGPARLLARWAKQTVLPVPQKTGPPQLVFNPQVAYPTRSSTYAGYGVASSGLLNKGRRWSLAFTKAGTYRYFCLIHYPGMFGVVVVHPRPAPAHTYLVRSGYGSVNQSYADAFFPDNLTIHVGDTVTWSRGFHTVAFGPASLIHRLRQQFILPVPQKTGPPRLVINPEIAYPRGGTTYDGKGLWNSGLLQQGPTHLTFTRTGVYHYGCLIHPGMDGTITVLPAA
jgi:plastocyanin